MRARTAPESKPKPDTLLLERGKTAPAALAAAWLAFKVGETVAG
jgi:hypothetical protein